VKNHKTLGTCVKKNVKIFLYNFMFIANLYILEIYKQNQTMFLTCFAVLQKLTYFTFKICFVISNHCNITVFFFAG